MIAFITLLQQQRQAAGDGCARGEQDGAEAGAAGLFGDVDARHAARTLLAVEGHQTDASDSSRDHSGS
jgi:hypothetical protein